MLKNLGPARTDYQSLTSSLIEDDQSSPTKWGINEWISKEKSLRSNRSHTLEEWAKSDQKTMMAKIEDFEYFQVRTEAGARLFSFNTAGKIDAYTPSSLCGDSEENLDGARKITVSTN